MNQPQLPFNTGSTPSARAAASHTTEVTGALEARVHDLIRDAGERGSTDEELETAMGLAHQTISARRRGLVRKGFVVDSGRERPTRSGRSAVVWVLGRGTVVDGRKLDKAARPENKVLQLGAVEILKLCAMAETHPSNAEAETHFTSRTEMEAIAKWLNHISKDA